MDACRAFGALLADAIAGSPFSDVLAPRRFTGAAAITQVIAGSWRGRTRDTIRSSGYVVHTLEAAIWSVARTGDFRGAVLLAANLADDADTVAAVTGQLAGALYGLNAIPDHWRERVAWKDRLLAAARRLLSEPLAEPVEVGWVAEARLLTRSANTDTKLLILWSVSKGRVLAQDALGLDDCKAHGPWPRRKHRH